MLYVINTCKCIDSFTFLTKFKFLIKYLSYYGAHLEFFVDFRKNVQISKASRVE